MNQTFLPAALFVFPIKTSEDGSVMTEGLGELCLSGRMVTTGYAAGMTGECGYHQPIGFWDLIK